MGTKKSLKTNLVRMSSTKKELQMCGGIKISTIQDYELIFKNRKSS